MDPAHPAALPASEAAMASETTPLLNHDSCSSAEAQKYAAQRCSKLDVTPLPKAQLITLCLVRIVVPIAFTQIFPYINEFIAFLRPMAGDDDSSQIGFYSGLVESSFAVSQLLFIYHWARLSDIYGRRPVLIIGTLGVALMTMQLGLSASIPELIVSRCIAGFFAATASVVHTILGEITDTTNQAAAFPLFGVTGPVGSIIGPLIGGTFSNPAKKYHLFDRPVFVRHPYLLPCAIAAVISLLGVVLAYCCLEESLPSKRRSNDSENTLLDAPSVQDHGQHCNEAAPTLPPPTAIELLAIPIIRALSLSGFALEVNGTSYVVLFVLFCFSPVQQGGLALPPSTIGYSLAFAGFVAGLTQLFFMPLFLRRFEASAIYCVCIAAWPIVFLLLPCLNVIARHGIDEVTGELGARARAIIWVGLVVDLALSRIGGIAYPASMILIKNNVPSPSYLGSTNGLVQWFMCLSRCISAVFASSAFAFSQKYDMLGGHFWAVLHASIAVVGWWLAREISLNSKSSL